MKLFELMKLNKAINKAQKTGGKVKITPAQLLEITVSLDEISLYLPETQEKVRAKYNEYLNNNEVMYLTSDEISDATLDILHDFDTIANCEVICANEKMQNIVAYLKENNLWDNE